MDRPGLVALGAGARVVRDDACYGGDDRSLASIVFGDRIIHEALNVHWRRGLSRSAGVADLVARMNEGLATRLGHTGIVATVEARAVDRPARDVELLLAIRFTQEGAALGLGRRFMVSDEW